MDTMEYKKELQNVSKPLEERVPNTPNFSWVEEDVKTTDLPFGSETRDSDVYNGGLGLGLSAPRFEQTVSYTFGGVISVCGFGPEICEEFYFKFGR